MLSFALGTSIVHAQPPESDLARARQRFEQGLAAVTDERWSDAEAAFQEAYDLSHRVAILINIATVQFNRGQTAQAYTTYSWLLDSDDTSPPHRQIAEESMMIIAAEIAIFDLSVEGLRPSDTIELNDAALDLRRPLALMPGSHTIVAKRRGQLLVARQVEAVAGTRQPLVFVLPDIFEEPTSRSRGLLTAPLDDEQPRGVTRARAKPRSWVRNPWVWVGATLFSAGAVATTVLVRGNREPPAGHVGSFGEGYRVAR